MTTQTRLRWGAVALVVLAVGLLSGSHLCGVALEKGASDPGMRPIGSGALACTEFWLNRYQTLIGAVTAVFAAAFAWRGVALQVASSERQVAIGRRQSAIALIDVLNRHTSEVSALANWVEKTCRTGKTVLTQSIIIANALKAMATNIEDPMKLSKIYDSRFDLSSKSHSSAVERLRNCIGNVQDFLDKSLISTNTKLDIEEFIMLARGLLANEVLARDDFERVVSVFDAPQGLRREMLQQICDEVDALSTEYNLFADIGFIAAQTAALNLSKLLDNALREAEGR